VLSRPIVGATVADGATMRSASRCRAVRPIPARVSYSVRRSCERLTVSNLGLCRDLTLGEGRSQPRQLEVGEASWIVKEVVFRVSPGRETRVT